MPLVATLALLAFVRPPGILTGETRLLDAALLLLLGGVLAQLVPLPAAVTSLLSPGAEALRGQILLQVPDAPSPAFVSLSIRPAATAYWLFLVGGFVLMFWTSRSILARGGLRLLLRTIATLGLGVSLIAIAQHATSVGLIYWFWTSREPSALVFGPFVNRNHFATWVLLAVPLCAGYLLARRRPVSGGVPPRRAAAIIASLDLTGVLLVTAIGVMTIALFVSASRSGVIGLLVATAAACVAGRSRAGRSGRRWTLLFAALLAVVVVRHADLDLVLARFEDFRGTGGVERVRIWRDTGAMIADFPLTGTGLGTYASAMTGYQRSDLQMLYNHGHNHYLHLAAEGGLLLAVPASLAIAGLVTLIVRRLREDTSGVFWIRLGAAAGLLAVAVQSLGETGLRAPANAALFALAAAIAVHRPWHSAERRRS